MTSEQFIKEVARAANEGLLRKLKPYSKLFINRPDDGDHNAEVMKVRDGRTYMLITMMETITHVKGKTVNGKKITESTTIRRATRYRYPYYMLKPTLSTDPGTDPHSDENE